MVTRFQDISQKDTSVIPKGEYCYDVPTLDRTICPYWQRTDYGMVKCNYMNLQDLDDWRGNDARQEAVAYYGGELEFEKNCYFSYLHDEQKICDVNMDREDEDYL
jgi:hypothetical protein